jgi:glycosyltransferase involved in cell wall biosynthesis
MTVRSARTLLRAVASRSTTGILKLKENDHGRSESNVSSSSGVQTSRSSDDLTSGRSPWFAFGTPPQTKRNVPVVLMITQHSPGEHPYVRRNLLELASRGFDVHVVCSAGAEGIDLTELAQAVWIHQIPIRHRRKPVIRYPFEYCAFFLTALWTANKLALRCRYDVVQIDNLPDHLAFAAPVARLRGARVVFNMFELMPEMVAARYPRGPRHGLAHVAGWIERAATGWSHHVIVVSQDCWRRVHARGVPASKLSIVLNTAPRPEGFPAPGDSRSSAEDAQFVVTHGTLVTRYGVHIAIEAFARLAQRWPKLEFRVIGTGEARGYLERLAADLGIADRVVFTGYLPWPETIEQISRAAVGIVSVLADGYGEILLPTKLLEYAAFDVPAVCARLPAIQDYFPDDSISYFSPGDPEQLAARLDRLLRSPSVAASQARRAAEIAKQLEWSHMRDAYIQALGLPPRAAAAVGRSTVGHGTQA